MRNKWSILIMLLFVPLLMSCYAYVHAKELWYQSGISAKPQESSIINDSIFNHANQ